MRFPALREMHQLSAAGKTSRGRKYARHGNDPISWAHVSTRFAGPRVKNQGLIEVLPLAADALSHSATTEPNKTTPAVYSRNAIRWSTVQRIRKPIFDVEGWMVSDADPPIRRGGADHLSTSFGGARAFNSPIQNSGLWVSDHRHLTKAPDAFKCLRKMPCRVTEPQNCDHRSTPAAWLRLMKSEASPGARNDKPGETTPFKLR